MGDMRFSSIYHGALAQYHRWYQVYEVPFTELTIKNQLDLLEEEIEISSYSGNSKGKTEIPNRLLQYDGWMNAHHVENSEVLMLENGQVLLNAVILYQNIRPDDSKHSYRINYSVTFNKSDEILPKISKVVMNPIEAVEPVNFEHAYGNNRIKSLIHYWLALMESGQSSVICFEEIITQDFKMKLSSGVTLNGYKEFSTWFVEHQIGIKSSAHVIKQWSIQEVDVTTMTVEVDFKWTGIMVDGREVNGTTHHEWVVVNDKEERFARIKEVNVSLVEPFTFK